MVGKWNFGGHFHVLGHHKVSTSLDSIGATGVTNSRIVYSLLHRTQTTLNPRGTRAAAARWNAVPPAPVRRVQLTALGVGIPQIVYSVVACCK